MARFLVIDDEQGIREVLSDILRDEGHEVLAAEDGIVGLRMLKTEPIDVVFLDVWLPNKGGIEVLQEIKQEYPEIEVIVISGHGNIDMAVRAVKMGAFDFLEKPLGLDRVLTVAGNAYKFEQLRRENTQLKLQGGHQEILGNSPGIAQVRHIIEQAAGTDSRILITGENGTGKELVAREIHQRSRRARRPFIEVNCAAIPDSLIESELFGHEKGAFTSAVGKRRGRFELADGGTLFLDEVADMSMSAQAKVLRAVQEFRFERVGGEESITADVRVIAATNKDIRAEIEAGNFREDLFFRLNVVPIHVPPLRERQDDIELLTDHFLDMFSSQHARPRPRISRPGMQRMREYHWPGNIRELKNMLERITIMAEDVDVGVAEVEASMGSGEDPVEDLLARFEGMTLGEAREQFERELIEKKLQQHDNNISQTAQALGVYPSNLHGKIRKLRIHVGK
ncbi:sigma-54-dependent transcriptional regulator [Spirochaeta africana]|uniref:Response regulator with CheY-like receiver, AAA-type ATPase, and DNA-binding domains n=1 Tax=Spirochaeta africana (strain ATCC 700263 / DSM 8902 / Z-7692) TaxID=889378 RepID=H9UME8_SPIAZ|nr:sigma-54 dependent transcriptional regulator [Spirochaeta africana]AFG38691.1 response regulator with CheY-like receiver, AAA-type ATPase, and DNA-binding domains [Spirochaeta africana DSM 8902]